MYPNLEKFAKSCAQFPDISEIAEINIQIFNFQEWLNSFASLLRRVTHRGSCNGRRVPEGVGGRGRARLGGPPPPGPRRRRSAQTFLETFAGSAGFRSHVGWYAFHLIFNRFVSCSPVFSIVLLFHYRHSFPVSALITCILAQVFVLCVPCRSLCTSQESSCISTCSVHCPCLV